VRDERADADEIGGSVEPHVGVKKIPFSQVRKNT